MKLYDQEDPAGNRKQAVKGCLTIVLLLIIGVGLPNFAIWLVNLNREMNGHQPLEYDVLNWFWAFSILLMIIVTKVLVSRRKNRRKDSDGE